MRRVTGAALAAATLLPGFTGGSAVAAGPETGRLPIELSRSASPSSAVDCGRLALGATNPAMQVEVEPFSFSKNATLTSFQTRIPSICRGVVSWRTRQIVVLDAGLRPNTTVSARVNRTFTTTGWLQSEMRPVSSVGEEWTNPETNFFVFDRVALAGGRILQRCGVRVVNELSGNESGRAKVLAPGQCRAISRNPDLASIRKAIGNDRALARQ